MLVFYLILDKTEKILVGRIITSIIGKQREKVQFPLYFINNRDET